VHNRRERYENKANAGNTAHASTKELSHGLCICKGGSTALRPMLVNAAAPP